jgi:hypothetical protein
VSTETAEQVGPAGPVGSVDPAVTPGLPSALATVTAAVVVGEPTVAALHAIATARAVARTRVVTIVDLIGDVAALRALAADDDPHGVADCFVYGISPKAVTRPTRASERLFVIPGGSESLAHESVLPSTRWARLINEYRQAGALLLFVAAVRTPGLPELIAQTDGVIAVGAVESLLPRDARILATASDASNRRRPARRAVVPAPRTAIWRQRSAAAVAAAIVVAAGIWMWTARPTHRAVLVPAAAAGQVATPLPAPAADTLAAAFARRVGTAPTYKAALTWLRNEQPTLAAKTIVPVVAADGAKSFALIAGAYHDRTSAGADSTVVQVPFALLLADSLSADSSKAQVTRYVARGIPAYALRDANGAISIYAGAFESADDATPLATSLRAAGLAPKVVQRAGWPL